MKKRVFVAVILFVSLFSGASVGANNQIQEEGLRVIETSIPSSIGNTHKTKKSLKKELRRRKNLHKSLVKKYNESFDTHILNFMHENALQLELLKTLL